MDPRAQYMQQQYALEQAMLNQAAQEQAIQQAAPVLQAMQQQAAPMMQAPTPQRKPILTPEQQESAPEAAQAPQWQGSGDAGNPYLDRITSLLQKRAQPKAPLVPEAREAALQAAMLGGESIQDVMGRVQDPYAAQEQQEIEYNLKLYELFETQRDQKNSDAESIGKTIEGYFQRGSEGYSMAVMKAGENNVSAAEMSQYMPFLIANDPEVAAVYQQEQALKQREREAKVSSTEALAKRRTTGGSGRKTKYEIRYDNLYNIAELFNVDMNDPQNLLNIDSLADKSLPSGAVPRFSTTDGQMVSIEMIPGMLDVLSESEESKKFGKLQAEAVAILPDVKSNTKIALQRIDAALNQDIGSVTGWLSLIPAFPAGDRRRSQALLNQALGTSFMAAYQDLKGGGQITEIEGEKGQEAIATLDNAQSAEDVIKGIYQLRAAIVEGLQKTIDKATMTPEQTIESAQEYMNEISKYGIESLSEQPVDPITQELMNRGIGIND